MAAAAVLPLLGYGAVSIVSLRSGAQQAVTEGNLNVARRAAEQIELYVTGSVKILKAVSADLEQTGLQRWQQDRILKNFVLQFPEYRELTLLDENGRAVVSSSLGTPTASVPGSEGATIDGAIMSSFSVDDDLLPTSIVAIRLGDSEGKGWLVGRLNLEQMWRMVDRIETGHGKPSDMDLLDSVAENIMGRTICALGDAAAMPVRGMLKHFRAEFEHHITHKTCMVSSHAPAGQHHD